MLQKVGMLVNNNNNFKKIFGEIHAVSFVFLKVAMKTL